MLKINKLEVHHVIPKMGMDNIWKQNINGGKLEVIKC